MLPINFSCCPRSNETHKEARRKKRREEKNIKKVKKASMALVDSKENKGLVHVHHHPHDEEYDSSFLLAMTGCLNQIHSAALNFAVEHKLFDIIAKANGRHVSASEVASHFPTSVQHQDLAFRLDRVLRLLASQSYLTCSYNDASPGGDNHVRERLYGISPVGKFFVSDNQNTNGYLALFAPFLNHPALLNTWLNFKDAIIDKDDDDLFKKVHGIAMYQYEERDPTLNSVFNKSMANLCNIEIRRILEVYKGFEGISTLVDVGGGIGQNLQLILSKYPSIKGINFDLPHVIQNAPHHPGIEHIGGDMFASIPKGDAIILKAVCHNWSDENCIKILSKCYEALPQGGKVIVVEFIMPEAIDGSLEANLVSSIDNLMFIHDGRERTEKEFESLCKRSGFSSFKVASRAFSALGIMEFCK